MESEWWVEWVLFWILLLESILIADEFAEIIDRRIVIRFAAVDLKGGLHVDWTVERVKVPGLRARLRLGLDAVVVVGIRAFGCSEECLGESSNLGSAESLKEAWQGSDILWTKADVKNENPKWKNESFHLHEFVLRIVLRRRIRFRFSFRSLWWRRRLLELLRKSFKLEYLYVHKATYHFLFLVQYISVELYRRRKHLSIVVWAAAIPHVRIHHPVVRVRVRWRMLLLNYRKNNRLWSIKLDDARRACCRNDLPSTNNYGQQPHVGNWVEVFGGADSCEAVFDYDWMATMSCWQMVLNSGWKDR